MPIRDDSQQVNQPNSPNSKRQHPVPQNVMDVEFKVVGDLTVRQLMYLFAGLIVLYILHNSGLPAFWRYILMTIAGITSIAVAFVPIQERGLDKWLVSFIRAMFTPSQMVWRKTYSPPAYFISDYAQIIKQEIITLTPAKSRSKLDDYLGQLPEAETDLDRVEFSRLKSIQSGFAQPMTAGLPIQAQPSMSYQTTPSLSGGTTVIEDTDDDTDEIEIIESKPIGGDKDGSRKDGQDDKKKEDKSVQSDSTDEKKKDQPKQKSSDKDKGEAKPKEKSKDEIEREKAKEEVKKHEMESKMELLRAIEKNKPTLKSPAIDRAIVNVPAELKGEIRIRTTTKIPKTIVFQDIKGIETKETSLQKKVDELLAVTRNVRKDMEANLEKGVKVHEVQAEHKGRLEFFSDKYKELEAEQEKLTTQIDKSTSRVSQVESEKDQASLTNQVVDLTQKNEELKLQLAQIQKELSILKNPKPIQTQSQTQKPTTDRPIKPVEKKSVSPDKAVFDADPNIIHGIVKNKDGQLVESAVVIIKDSDGDAIRALKTNQLGQFKTQTPLQNGKYTVEVIKGGSKFDIISVEAAGEPLSSIQIIAYE